MILAWLLLLTGLTISAVAIYYSVVGLAAIFSAALIPIVVMGSSLEVAKLVCASWLKANWNRAPGFLKAYMTIAVVVLMFITSMGIFGFLSKAHNDQSLVSGDVQSKIAVYDEKIKTAKENIDANRKALKQMDEAVDQSMARSTDEKGADKAVAIRRGQQKERARLLSEITAEQKTISALSEERAPIAAEVRKVEAEVGPIKYIAAFIYGDNPDANVLEKAVTWVIILIVIVFDPLAVIMLLAAQMTFGWKPGKDEEPKPVSINDIVPQPTEYKPDEEEILDTLPRTGFVAQEVADILPEAVVTEESVYEPLHCYKCGTELMNAPGIGPFCPNKDCDVLDKTDPDAEPITFTYIPPAPLVANEQDDKDTWPYVDTTVAIIETEEPPVKKPRKPKQEKTETKETKVKPVRNKKREEEQSALLTQFIEATSPTPAPDERPGDYVSTSTVTREGTQDDLDNKYQEMVQDLQPEKQSKYRRKPGFFPEVKRNTDNT
jgi:hypothetical protein